MGLLNIDELLAPISESQPCGLSKETSEDLALLNAYANVQREGETFRKIEKTRVEIELLDAASRAEKISQSAGRSDDPKKDTNWAAIAVQCVDILQKQSKDARIVSWLIESSLRSAGFRGLSESLQFAAKLVDTYGTNLFPLDEEDELYALSFLDKLNQSTSVIDGLGRIPFNKGSRVSYSSKVIARHLEKLTSEEERAQLQESGLMVYDEIAAEIQEASTEVKQDFLAGVSEALESAKLLDQSLSSKSSSLGFGNIVKEIKAIHAWFSELAGEALDGGDTGESSANSSDSETEDESSENKSESSTARPQQTSGKSGVIQTREDAIANLVRVASFFRKSEPHSPVSYALEQAVRWGKMPLPELLMDLVQNADVRSEVFRRLGILEKTE